MDRFISVKADAYLSPLLEGKNFILDLEGVLNNAQIAKLIGFERRLRQEVKDQMKEHRKGKDRSHGKRGRKKGFWN